MVVGLNCHSTDIPFQSDEEFSFDENLATNEYFAFGPKGTRGRDVDDFSIAWLYASGSKKGFTLVTGPRIVCYSVAGCVNYSYLLSFCYFSNC